MKSNIRTEMEVIQISKYIDIIIHILSTEENMTILKVVVYSYIINENSFNYKNIFTAHHTNQLVNKSIASISGTYDKFLFSVEYIMKAIDALIHANKIACQEDELYWIEGTPNEKIQDGFINRAVKASKLQSDRQILKEVVSIV